MYPNNGTLTLLKYPFLCAGVASQPRAEKNGSSTAQNPAASNAFSDLTATNDPFGMGSTNKQDDGFENPFQLDPFLFSPQPGANSFEVAPGTDPFSIPPLPTDILNQAATADIGNTVFDDLGQLDSSAGGGFDIFNFGSSITSGADPYTNGRPTVPAIAGNPIGDVSNTNGLNFDLDLLDDRLFESLDQLDVQDGNWDLTTRGQQSTSFPQPFAPSPGGAAASGGRQNKSKTLNQEDFDNLWDGIYATMPPTTDS